MPQHYDTRLLRFIAEGSRESRTRERKKGRFTRHCELGEVQTATDGRTRRGIQGGMDHLDIGGKECFLWNGKTVCWLVAGLDS